MINRSCIWIGLLTTSVLAAGEPFPPELVEFVPYEHNPVFTGRGPGYWDELIRERGWILHEDGVYHLWYTGYSRAEGVKKFGYATSRDGLAWERYSDHPIHDEHWVEDMTVIKHDGDYHMFAEGRNDEACHLVSTDRIHWDFKGKLDVRKSNGEPIPPGPFGTPAVIHENGVWHLFYEREDEAIWLADSTDMKTWKLVQDEPVLTRGPGAYDRAMIALDQVVKHKGRYYAYYHGLIPDTSPQEWTSAMAASDDLIHWDKFKGNPLLAGDRSSPLLIQDGEAFRLYTMHPAVNVYLPRVRHAGRKAE